MNTQDPARVEQEIRARVAVDAQLLLLAKVSLTEHCTGEMQSQLDAFVASLDARHPNPVVIHPTVDVEAASRQSLKTCRPRSRLVKPFGR